MRKTCLVLFGLFIFLSSHTQLPTIQGSSSAQAGMLYYDVDQAKDRRERIYVYTIQADSSRCLQFDFTLVQGPEKENYIYLYSGTGKEGEMKMQLGGETGSRLFQVEDSCVTVEFIRAAASVNSTWTLTWRSDRQGGCMEAGTRLDSCPEVQEICGPEFVENFHYFGPGRSQATAVEGACIDRPHHSSWYKFVANRDGQLQFTITPRNGLDDFDWVLWQMPADSAPDCPTDLKPQHQRACNHAAGRGARGSTGMDLSGQLLRSAASGNPFSSTAAAKKGDVFFLLVDDYSQHSAGFKIDFNEVVMPCRNPKKDFLPLGHKPPLSKPKVPKRNHFTRYTRILRIDLNEKANHPLRDCQVSAAAIQSLSEGKALDGNIQTLGSGVTGAILSGLKYARFPAYAAHDHATPIHFGDLLAVAGKEARWEGDNGAMDGYGEVVELIVDEVFDRTTGRKIQLLQMIRLVWSHPDSVLAEKNVALLQFDDVAPLLDQMEVPNPHNEAATLTALDFIKGQMYNSITISQRNKPNRSLEEASFEGQRGLEFEDYRWEQ